MKKPPPVARSKKHAGSPKHAPGGGGAPPAKHHPHHKQHPHHGKPAHGKHNPPPPAPVVVKGGGGGGGGPAKKRKLAVADGVPCVAAAVAACLRLPEDLVAAFCDRDGDLIEDILTQALGLTAQPPGGLILGLQLPEGPHAVYAQDGRWLTWGEWRGPDEFPGAVIEEAWEVAWA